MTVIQGVLILFGVLAYYGCVSLGNPVKFEPCKDSPDREPNSVDVTPCPEQPCVFDRGTTVNTTIKFTPKQAMTSGKLEIFGVIFGVKTPFPLENPDPCEKHGLVCPLKENVEVALTLSLPIKPEYPPIQLIAIFDLKDQDDHNVFCFQMPIKIG